MSSFSPATLKGFAEGNTIDDAEKSLNTNELYTHYHLQLPNSKCAFTMEWQLPPTVYDEDDDNAPVLTACFMVVEPAASVGLRILTNTDADIGRPTSTSGYGGGGGVQGKSRRADSHRY